MTILEQIKLAIAARRALAQVEGAMQGKSLLQSKTAWASALAALIGVLQLAFGSVPERFQPWLLLALATLFLVLRTITGEPITGVLNRDALLLPPKLPDK